MNWETPKVTEAYSICLARYAKGKVVVRTPSQNGWMTHAAYLAAKRGRYVHRSGGYVMSPAAARKFIAAFVGA